MRTRLILFALILLAFTASPFTQSPASYDVLIRNGRVLDGSGNPWIATDIGIRGGRIVDMGRLGNAAASRVIDAQGRTVSPGFIDVHSHASQGLEGSLKEARQLIAQGITTVALNPDGGGTPDLRTQRAGFEQRGVGVNVALYVPHGAIRREIVGMADRAPTAAELDRMIAMARNGMEAGGIGLSSGLYYAPGSYAKTEEVIAIAKVVGEMGGVYESHIRDEADYNIGVVGAVQEVIRIAEEGHLPGIVAHMKALGPASWGLSMALVERIKQARDRGVEVYADQYPYDASGTGIVGALIPRWAEVGGRNELLGRIQGADHDRLAADIRRNFERRGGPEKLVISRYAPNPSYEGQSLAQVAKALGKPADETAMELLLKGDASLVSFNMTEGDIELIMRQTVHHDMHGRRPGSLRSGQAASPRQRRVRAEDPCLRERARHHRSAVRDPLDDEPARGRLRLEGSRNPASGRMGRRVDFRSREGAGRGHLPGTAPAVRGHGLRPGERHHREGR